MWYNWAMDVDSVDRFQVLALDGGGIRGIFVAALLAGLEADLGHPVVDSFDLVVGTSTGGIIALALGAGLSPAQILDVYVSQQDRIFPRRFPSLRNLRWLFGAKYDAAGLESVLREVLGDRQLGDSLVPLVIPAFDLSTNDVHLFKTAHHPRLRRDWKLPMWSVAMATSAAPTYFPTFRLPGEESRLVDGGVWANNPAMVGLTEAVSLFGQPLAGIRLLSIGTTTDVRARPRRFDGAGVAQWLLRSPGLLDVVLRAQGVGAFAQARLLLGDSAHRLSPFVSDAELRLDRADAADLIALASHHSRQFSPQFITTFDGHVRRPYLPAVGEESLHGAR